VTVGGHKACVACRIDSQTESSRTCDVRQASIIEGIPANRAIEDIVRRLKGIAMAEGTML
jgi:hypothetical protein